MKENTKRIRVFSRDGGSVMMIIAQINPTYSQSGGTKSF
jgi:hypothetical protein